MLAADKHGQQTQHIARVREFKPITNDRAMQVALDRARAAQPPIRSMAANVADPWRTQ